MEKKFIEGRAIIMDGFLMMIFLKYIQAIRAVVCY